MALIPFIEIPIKSSDVYTYYELGKTRMDLLSYQYYDDPNFGWLIMQANPEYGSMEFSIPDGARIRIPYPLSSTLVQYENDIKVYSQLYGLSYTYQ